ncbi:hypothetical protein ACT3TP_14935 [Glutamicibacter sp. AOP38-B1-38]|uniref:hypothetical protein n=1 Tax=Glutamicibacter sp. AOP38-B1-38 TaxID=3457680 RepID=UPI004034D038
MSDIRQNLAKSPEIQNLSIDPRSVTQIVIDARRGTSEKPLSPWQHHTRWSAKDAGIMCERMRELYQSPYALLTTAELISRGNFVFPPGTDPARSTAQRYLDFWASDDVLIGFLDDPTADMVLASSLSAPPGVLHEDELIAPRGIVFFQNPTRMFEDIFTDLPPEEIVPVRAIAWELPVEQGQKLVSLTTYFDGSEQVFTEIPFEGYSAEERARTEEFIAKTASYLSTGLINNIVLDLVEDEPKTSSQRLINYLRALNAISQSPRTSSITKAVAVAKRKKGKRTYTKERPVTIMSLHKPETAQYELDGVRGTVQRQHWVRGHWRKQWYATMEDHRLKWIDGFIKGDPELGTVNARKVTKF